MNDPLYDAVPPGGYSPDDDDLDRARRNEDGGWADMIVDEAIDEARRRAGRKQR